MSIIESKISNRSAEFLHNREAMQALVDDRGDCRGWWRTRARQT
jgi:hypothetical protein